MKARIARLAARLAAIVVFGYVGLALADAVLRLTPANVHVGRHEGNVAAARRAGLDFDRRTGWEVILDLRARGERAFPFVTMAHFRRGEMDRRTDAGDVLVPLGGISRVETVACNETGTWMVYESDEHGFNNPTGLYRATPAIAIVGDSFAHGTCLNRGLEFASLLRAEFGPTLTFGVHGSGPLGALAQIREYAAPLEPPVVLWVYYEGNDVTVDLPRELRDPTLARYLDPRFRQGLLARQRAVDRLIVDQIAPPADPAAARAGATWGQAVVAVATLAEVRTLARKSLGRLVRTGPIRERWFEPQYREPLAAFERVLRTARDEVAGWGGRLVFVYLPSWEAFHARWNDGVVLKPEVVGIARSLGLEVVDAEPAFRDLDRPEDAFALGLPNHYGAAGNRAVADAIADALRAEP